MIVLALTAALVAQSTPSIPEVVQNTFPTLRATAVRSSQSFAVAQASGILESYHFHGEVLLERFSFGWQVIDLDIHGISHCMLTSHGAPGAVASRLASQRFELSYCGIDQRDYGAQNDIDSVRRLAQSEYDEAVSSVIVWKDVAVINWWGAGGGMGTYHRVSGAWKHTGSGGGCLPAATISEMYGMPVSLARHVGCEKDSVTPAPAPSP
ncbi:MAG: hypothetical protein JOZ38_00445 [Candidatus Eremiobacteraeota bacterium]|nr:hypothetical protein [Candidatus Eremiobacteraeota bacterium]